MNWRAVVLRVLLLASAVAAANCHAKPEATASPIASIPEYQAPLLDGKPFQLPDPQGRVLLLNVWATWCAPCRDEIPELKELQKQYQDRKFDVIGISVDEKPQEATVRSFARDYAINYPVVLDPYGRMAQILESFALPTSALIDRSGKVVWYKVGRVDPRDPEFRRALNAAL